VEDSSVLEARLSYVLRWATAENHRDTESARDLPQSLRNRTDCLDLLKRFCQLHAPLEASRYWVGASMKSSKPGMRGKRSDAKPGKRSDLAV
jgi:hypothetical protein